MLAKIDTDKILGTGLVSALILFITGNVIIVLCGLVPLPMELGNTIVTGLVAYMGRSLVDKLAGSKNKPDDTN
ncbi:MAG: hypothetical protein IKE46_07875 [Selenomonadaceae bacterium]|nr:hypothetical protein [Selenomonadaceae bacterium]MBR4384368.1 hypothetical protein [Selenomonadaceae bacterium]